MALDADRGFRRNLGTVKSLSFVRQYFALHSDKEKIMFAFRSHKKSSLTPMALLRSIRKLVTVLLWVTVVQLIPVRALANVISTLTITPDPLSLSVLEGQSGVFNFTVKNEGVTDVTIKDIRYPDSLLAHSFEYVSGDQLDEVFNTQFANESNCEGKTLSTGGTCAFKQLFDTRDLNKSFSGTNVGIWLIKNVVLLTTASDPAFPDLFDFNLGKAKVEVRDPDAPTTIPEPSAVLLLCSGFIGVLAFRRKRNNGSSRKSVDKNAH